MKFRGTAFSAGDVIWRGRAVYLIRGCAFLDSNPYMICDCLAMADQVSAAASRWRLTPGADMLLLRLGECEISLPAAFFWEDELALVALAWRRGPRKQQLRAYC